MAANAGRAGLRVHVLPYPLESRPDAEVRQIAREHWPRLLETLGVGTNVGGQVVGVSSKSVFGQPGRVAGIVVDEWEERSLWAPLDERRGVAGEAVTVHDDGLVHLVAGPEHMLVMVCGGLGNLHALALHSFGPTRAVTRPF